MDVAEWWTRIESADALGDERRRDQLLSAIVEELESLAARHPGPELHFVAGYAQYVRPSRKVSELVRDSCERHLRDALSLDPAHARARLYLGHLCFDHGDLADARGWLKGAAGQLDSVLEAKRRELLVVCAFELDGVDEGFKAFEEFRDWCAGVSAIDVLPQELIDAAAKVQLSESQRGSILEFAQNIDKRATEEAIE